MEYLDNERREETRLVLTTKIKLLIDDKTYTGYSKDISANGAFFHIVDSIVQLKKGDKGVVIMEGERWNDIPVWCEINRVEEQGVGVQFGFVYEKRGFIELNGDNNLIEVNVVEGQKIDRNHFVDIVCKYQQTFDKTISPLPDADKWIVLTEKKTKRCIATLALKRLHVRALPVLFSKISKTSGLAKVFDQINGEINKGERKITLENSIELGTLTLQVDRISKSNIKRIILALFYETLVQAKQMNCEFAVVTVTNLVRRLFKSCGIRFFQFPDIDTILDEEDTLSDASIQEILEDELNTPKEIIDSWLRYYFEINVDRKKFHVQHGFLDADQVLCALKSKMLVKKTMSDLRSY